MECGSGGNSYDFATFVTPQLLPVAAAAFHLAYQAPTNFAVWLKVNAAPETVQLIDDDNVISGLDSPTSVPDISLPPVHPDIGVTPVFGMVSVLPLKAAVTVIRPVAAYGGAVDVTVCAGTVCETVPLVQVKADDVTVCLKFAKVKVML